MPAKKYIVKLETDEREQLLEMTSKGAIGARKMKRAQILLKAMKAGRMNTSSRR